MRVSLKSPVRENRTPGSVRGQSGNWLAYRDAARPASIKRRHYPKHMMVLVLT